MTSSGTPGIAETVDLSPAYIAENRPQPLIATASVLIVMNTLFVGLRSFTRWKIQGQKFGWDDYFIYPTYILCIAQCAASLALIPVGGIGRHIIGVYLEDPNMITSLLKFTFATSYIYLPAVMLPKLSILCLYLRLFAKGVVQPWVRVCVYIVMGLVVASFLAFAITIPLVCRPTSYIWNRNIPGYCLNVEAFYKSVTGPSIVTDVLIILLPIPTVWKLHIPNIQKLGVSVILAMGIFGMIAGILRMVTFFDETAFTDITWTSVRLNIWFCVEPSMYLIAACLPALPALITYILPPSLRKRIRDAFTPTIIQSRISGSPRSPGESTKRSSRVYSWLAPNAVAGLPEWSTRHDSLASEVSEVTSCGSMSPSEKMYVAYDGVKDVSSGSSQTGSRSWSDDVEKALEENLPAKGDC